jgi:hypothetical protein
MVQLWAGWSQSGTGCGHPHLGTKVGKMLTRQDERKKCRIWRNSLLQIINTGAGALSS